MSDPESIFSVIHASDLCRVKCLLENGISVNMQDAEGNGLIHIAVLVNYPELVTLLLNSGANLNIRNKAGETPLMLAVKNGRSLLLDLLFKYSAEEDLNDFLAMTSYLLQSDKS